MKYAVVIDAGSSGSRAFVYSWPDSESYLTDLSSDSPLRKALLPVETKPEWIKKVSPGISSYNGQSDKNVWNTHLSPLISHVKDIVPSSQQRETPIYFLATAGLRLLEESERNRLLAIVCRYFQKKTSFYLPECGTHVQMIDGQTEGLYGWLGLNYLVHHGLNHPWDDFTNTYGFLDMGGASAQLAYALPATSEHQNDLHSVQIRNAEGSTIQWRVFVTTWLGYGANQAQNRLHEELIKSVPEKTASEYTELGSPIPVFDPCLPPDVQIDSKLNENYVFQGSGDWQKCESVVGSLLRQGVPCVDEPCLFDGVHVPDLNLEDGKFVGVSEYWYTMHDFFGNKGKFDYSTLEPKVSELCSRPLKDTQEYFLKNNILRGGKEPFSEEEIRQACFKSAWVLTVLRKGFGFPLAPENPTLGHDFKDTFQSAMEIEGAEISWTLGRAVLYAASEIAPKVDDANDQEEPHAVGFTTLQGEFVAGGGQYSLNGSKIGENSGIGPFHVFTILLFAGVILFFIVGPVSYRNRLAKLPLIKRLRRKLKELWGNEDHTAIRIGYGSQYPHADIPLSTFSTSSRPQFRVPSRVGSRQNLASRHD